jgi:hypothetical protein
MSRPGSAGGPTLRENKPCEAPWLSDSDMDENKDKSVKDLARKAELRLTGSVLRWRYRKQGKAPPSEEEIENRSVLVTDEVNRILARRGKNLWKGFKSLIDGE